MAKPLLLLLQQQHCLVVRFQSNLSSRRRRLAAYGPRRRRRRSSRRSTAVAEQYLVRIAQQTRERFVQLTLEDFRFTFWALTPAAGPSNVVVLR